MSKADDDEILALSLTQNATVVTMDADFHAIVAVSGASRPSVIRIRIQGLDTGAVVRLIQTVVTSFETDLRRGSLVTVKAHKITCHRLPIGGSD